MRLALVSRRYPPLIGGAEKMLSYLAAGLAAEGCEVTVLTARSARLPAIEAGATPRGRLTIERLTTSPLRFAGTMLYMRNLSRRLRRGGFDLVYVSMLKHDAYAAVGAARAGGFPVVLRPEGAGATGDVAWQGWGRFGAAIARRCRAADAFVSISEAITRELVDHGYDASKIASLPNGVPVPEEPWRGGEPARDGGSAVFVGRLAAEKGLDVLVRAWTIVLAERPAARLTLVGEGPQRARLAALIAAEGTGRSIALPGAAADATPALRAADVFVLPSREEGMSIALLEAMALGMPVVASAIAGNLKLIVDREHGRTATPDDPAALAGAILDQLRDVEAARAQGWAARGRVAREFSIAAVSRRHVALFERLIAAGRDRARRR